MKHTVLNSAIGSPYSFGYPALTETQEINILAELFEQLLLFDEIVITTNRDNFALFFLIKKLGINTVELLIEREYIKFMIWSPLIVTGTGMQADNGSIDESVIYGQPPIIAGALHQDDLNPDLNIQRALSKFPLHRERKRTFTKNALRNYVIPNGMEFSTKSADVVIGAYKNNSLHGLQLPYQKEPEQLDKKERLLLLDLGHKVLETAILSKYKLKSYNNYEHYEICKQNIENIGKAYNISDNTSTLFKLENLLDLKELYIKEHFNFEAVLKIRNSSNAKYYRKWINELGGDANANEITKEYLNQIKGTNKFFESTEGKFLKSATMFGVSAAIEVALGNSGVGIGVGIALGLLETYWIDSMVQGKNPSMFIDDVERIIKQQQYC